MADDYGQLDHYGTLMYIPRGFVMRACMRTIKPKTNIRVGVKGCSAPITVDHPGGEVMYLREDSSLATAPALHSNFPFMFIAPSIVTVSKADLKEMAIDLDSPRSHNSAPWPGVSQLADCPCCRAQTKSDKKTEYVLCHQGAMMEAYPEKGQGAAMKLLWRLFCVPCFARLANDTIEGFAKVLADGSLAPTSLPVIDVIRSGRGAPFTGTRGDCVVPAYLRTKAIVETGLSATIASDYQEYFLNILGGRVSSNTASLLPGQSEQGIGVISSKMFAVCSAEDCKLRAFTANANMDGNTRTKPLMLCSKCKTARYCSRECQGGHWKAHKKECARLAELKISGAGVQDDETEEEDC